MDKYKPEYMGKVLPADDQNKLTDFVSNKYDAFSKAYDACKECSDKIKDVCAINNNSTDSFSMKLSTGSDVIEQIKAANTNPDISITGDVITAKT